ncbi:hypothetical protein ACFXPS_05625 [Nocardia sp. NPDC059091]|uniref:hypothetical protein n=1 Tax=unclassified Nocardia TaxID=2637762 RepID=UPI0036C50914
MSSFVNASITFGGLHGIKYEPASVYTYGESAQYLSDIPARVTFKVGDVRIGLTIADAQALLEALPAVLAQHDYAEFVADGLQAVAR